MMRKARSGWGALLAAAVVAATRPAGGGPGGHDPRHAAGPAKERRFRFTYGAVIKGLRPGGRVRVWIPVPREDRFQRVALVGEDLPGPPRIATERTYGNRILFFEAAAPPSGEIAFSRTYDVARREAAPYEGPEDPPADWRFLLPNRLVPTSGAPLRLLRGIEVPSDPARALRVLYDRVLGFMRYDKSRPGWGRGDAVWACRSGFGNCTDFHSLWISLVRSRGIPGRFEIGFPLPRERGEGGIGGYHCWAWGFAGGRWVPVDISEADKHPERAAYFFGRLDANRIHFTTGRDIAPTPEAEAGPLNYFVKPYVEVDGRPHEGVELRCRYEDRDRRDAMAGPGDRAAPLYRPSVVPAFPGAEGFGAETPGGRGGRVIAVTTLADAGPGSLRAALEADGPRIVVFRVGGTIALRHHLRIRSPYVTVAGQTAPGDGILIRNAGIVVETHDVVLRHLRVRIGASAAEPANTQDAIHVGSGEREVYRVVVDHGSFSWAIDEVASAAGPLCRDVTFGWCIFSEGLMRSLHHKGAHSMGILLGGHPDRIAVHHSLFAHNNQRSPRIQGGLIAFVNNAVYDWGGIMAQLSRSPRVNFIGNLYRPGPSSARDRKMILGGEDVGEIYLEGNVVEHFPRDAWDRWEDLVQDPAAGRRAARPFAMPRIRTTSAREAWEAVLAGAGATRPRRDAVDARIVREAREGKGRIIDRPEDAGGFPPMRGGRVPPDRDGDGMPDAWEITQGLDPDDPGDGRADADGDGYTNLEAYLNLLVGQAPEAQALGAPDPDQTSRFR